MIKYELWVTFQLWLNFDSWERQLNTVKQLNRHINAMTRPCLGGRATGGLFLSDKFSYRAQ